MLELARQRADGVINRSKTRDTPCFPLAAKGRLGVWNSHRGNHLGQRSCASAKTGRTYGRKRSDQSTAQITLRGGGRPHMGSRHPGSLRLPEVTILSENRCSMPTTMRLRWSPATSTSTSASPANLFSILQPTALQIMAHRRKQSFSTASVGSRHPGSLRLPEVTQLGHEPSGCLSQIDQYC